MDVSMFFCGTIAFMKWKPKSIINKSIKDTSLEPIIEQLLLQRGFYTKDDIEKFFNPNFDNDFHDPFLFKDMNTVVKRVALAYKNKESIGIFGDHDADGVCSATILAEGLEKRGCEVVVYIPDKMTEGHGINYAAINEFAKKGVTLMFSVDCGTSNVAEVAYANEKGINVIITDHHNAPEILPDAFAIINPRIKGNAYPFTELSGTAVAFKVLHAIYSRLFPLEIHQLKWFLDVVCVGTIADCMPLIGENRTLVKYGLIVLSKTRRIGYQELFIAGNIAISPQRMPTATLVAFHVAPRINAPGRMSHAKHAYHLLREISPHEARTKAMMIEKYNNDRKIITEKITREVDLIVKKEFTTKSCIIIAGENYPIGIVGIVAGRIAEKYKKPTGIFTKQELESRGSFRSVTGVHIVDMLTACGDLLIKFGGHEKAAGAIIRNDNFDAFCKNADAFVHKLLPHGLEVARYYDHEIQLADISEALLQKLTLFEPYGEANEEPIFLLRDVVLADVRVVGSGQLHVKIKVSNVKQDQMVDAIGFSLKKKCDAITDRNHVNIFCHVQKNSWQGRDTIQLHIIDIYGILDRNV